MNLIENLIDVVVILFLKDFYCTIIVRKITLKIFLCYVICKSVEKLSIIHDISVNIDKNSY